MVKNNRGIVPLAIALIISGAMLISSLIIAYKPQIYCTISKKDEPTKVISASEALADAGVDQHRLDEIVRK